MLLVNTTNVDFGDLHAWDIVAEAKTPCAAGTPQCVHRILLATAGIPAIFPAQRIGDSPLRRRRVTGNILYGGRVDAGARRSPALWQRETSRSEPMPPVRYWVIFNNQLRFPPQVTQERWPDIMSRATIMSTQTATRERHAPPRTRWPSWRGSSTARTSRCASSIPDDWVPPSPGTFKKDVMNALADLGEKMGADPASGRSRATRRCGKNSADEPGPAVPRPECDETLAEPASRA